MNNLLKYYDPSEHWPSFQRRMGVLPTVYEWRTKYNVIQLGQEFVNSAADSFNKNIVWPVSNFVWENWESIKTGVTARSTETGSVFKRIWR